jgi:hypothetical protein
MNTKGKVPATETGATRGDGSGTRQFTAMPKARGHNVTMNSGRHATGQSLAQPGNIRGGQSEPASNKGGGITGSRTAMRPTPGILNDAKETSRDLEKRLLGKATQPFTNEDGAATLAAASVNWNPSSTVPYDVHTNPNSGPQVKGGGHAPMGKAAMEAAASVDGMPSSAGMNPINGGRAPWMRKD